MATLTAPQPYAVVDVQETIGGFTPYGTRATKAEALKLAAALNKGRNPGYKGYAVFKLELVQAAPDGA